MNWRLEWREQRAIAAGLAFVLTAVFAVYLGLQATQGIAQLSTPVWSLLFWLLVLFMALYVGSALGEMQKGRTLFLFLLASPLQIWTTKALHFFSLLLLLSGLTAGLMYLWIEGFSLQWACFGGVVWVALMGFAASITTISLMVARVEAPSLLFVVLSLPLLVPLLVFALRASSSCSVVLPSTSDIWSLVAFVLLIVCFSILLFPYIWRT